MILATCSGWMAQMMLHEVIMYGGLIALLFCLVLPPINGRE